MADKGQTIADTLAVFGEKSKDADDLKATVLDIVRKISESKEGQGSGGWNFGDFLSAPLSPHQGDVDAEGVDSLKNLILAPESYKDGGEVGLGGIIKEINQLFSSQKGGAKLSDQTDFMKRVAATESNLGKDELGDHSFSAFQLDPIRYKDIQERGVGGAAKARVDVANKFLSEKLGRKDFDLLNLDLKKEDHNPYIGSVLAR